MRFSKATLAASLALAFAAHSSMAMGVAGISARSGLYEPLRADVRIVLGPNDDYSSQSVKIAAPDKFAAAGLAYPAYAGDILATYSRDSARAKEPILRLRSTRPIYEPVVKLLLEARVGDGSVYIPITIMLDSSFEAPLDSSSLSASLPAMTPQARARAMAAENAKAPKPPQNASAAQAMPANPKPAASAPSPKPAAEIKKPAPAQPANASLGERVAALEKGQQALTEDMSVVRKKLSEVGDSVQALRDLAEKAAPSAQASNDAKPNIALQQSNPATLPVKPAPAEKPQPSAAIEPLAAPAEPKPAEAKPSDAKPPEPAAIDPKPSEPAQPVAAEPAKPAAPVEPPKPVAKPKPLPASLPAPNPRPDMADMLMGYWPFGAAALALAGVGAFIAKRRGKKNASTNNGHADDTYGDFHPTSAESSDLDSALQDSAETSGSVTIGEKDNKPASGSIDELHDQIFSADAMESLVDAIEIEARHDSDISGGFQHLEDMNTGVDGPDSGAFDMSQFSLPDASKPKAPAEDALDLSGLQFDLPDDQHAQTPASANTQPAAKPEPVPAKMDFDFNFDQNAANTAKADDVLSFDDSFTRAMNVAKSTESRSGGAELSKKFVIAPNLEDSPGRLQLELACLYAQNQEWDNARSALKEVLGEDEMAQAHPEARRLMAMLP